MATSLYPIDIKEVLSKRLLEKSPLIQVLLGPRQVGKTTAVLRLKEIFSTSFHYYSADNLGFIPQSWLREKWLATPDHELLVVDEIQKIENWSELVKELWDLSPKRIKVLLLGSSSIHIQKGLSESLTGRFELLRAHHWSFSQSRSEFSMSFEDYFHFGGYPGSYELIKDYDRWQNFIRDSIVDTVINKDLLTLARVQRPVLFRQAFDLLCMHPAQEISYTKLLGQLQEKGNVEIIKHYIQLFEGAFLMKSLQKFRSSNLISRLSSPKILPLAPALVTQAVGRHDMKSPMGGRIFECLVGSDLCKVPHSELFYWREKNDEVDFILQVQGKVYAIEVKSGRKKGKGLLSFKKAFKKAKLLFITPDNYLEFCLNPAEYIEENSQE